MGPSSPGGILLIEIAIGATPLAFRPVRAPARGAQGLANRSPPRPQAVGSITPRQAFVAIAASTALPPALSISMPAPAASGCEQHTMPFAAHVTDRVALPRPLPNACMSANDTGDGGGC